MTTPRYIHTATLLANGKVLITGQDFPNGNATAGSADLYDPSTGTFTSAGRMTTAGEHTAILLTNGKVLFVGSAVWGRNDGRPGDEIYDPDAGTFSRTGGSPYLDKWPESASLLTNGKVLVTLAYPEGPSDFAEVYDPWAGAFTATGTMTARQKIHIRR